MYDTAKELGYQTKYRKDYETWKYGVYATKQEFQDIKIRSGIYES